MNFLQLFKPTRASNKRSLTCDCENPKNIFFWATRVIHYLISSLFHLYSRSPQRTSTPTKHFVFKRFRHWLVKSSRKSKVWLASEIQDSQWNKTQKFVFVPAYVLWLLSMPQQLLLRRPLFTLMSSEKVMIPSVLARNEEKISRIINEDEKRKAQ